MKVLRFIIPLLVLVMIFSISCSYATEEPTVEETGEEKLGEEAVEEAAEEKLAEEDIKDILTESERKQAFYDLVEYQDSVDFEDPEYDEKQEEAYTVIAKRYGITEDQMYEIGVEGIANNWPMPAVEEETAEDEEATYIIKVIILVEMVSETMRKGEEAAYNVADGEITLAEHKILVEQNIKDVNEFYDFYLTLKPTNRFKSSHEQLGESMKHFLNYSIYMQKYIDTENTDEMINNINNATTELQLATAYIKKATDEINKLKF